MANPFLITRSGIFSSPIYFVRRGLYKKIKENAPVLTGRMMDFGCGSKPYKSLFNVAEYIGVDIAVSGHDHKDSHVDVFYDGKHLPFEDSHFDSVFASEVFEHVFNLDDILAEIHRVMKPNALILVTIPFSWPEHEVPYDFARYSSFGIKHVLEKNGFEMVKIEKSGNFMSTVGQLFIFYIYSKFSTWHWIIRKVLALVLVLPLSLLVLVMSRIMPDDKSLYLNSMVLARKKQTGYVQGAAGK
jgi:ubiquinone/menaquinone biosynthesis C-methylase UbiE